MEKSQTHKDIIDDNRPLLLRNIIPCDDLFQKLLEQNVFSEAAIKEIKQCEGRETVIARMLELLCLRGRTALQRFCDALQLSGHNLLADSLRDELTPVGSQEGRSAGTPKDHASILTRLVPKEADRQELTKYINSKIKEQVLQQEWKKRGEAKEKALDAKQQQLVEALEYQEKIKFKDMTINEATSEKQKLIHELTEKAAIIKSLQATLENTKRQYEEQLANQMKFNTANDKTVQRFTNKYEQLDAALINITASLNASLGKLRPKSVIRSASSIQLEHLQKENTLGRLQDVVKIVIQRVDAYGQLESRLQQVEQEQRYIAQFIGLSKPVVALDIVQEVKRYVQQREALRAAHERQTEDLRQQRLLTRGMVTSEKHADLCEELRQTRTDLDSARLQLQQLQQQHAALTARSGVAKRRAATPRGTPRPSSSSLSDDDPTPKVKVTLSEPRVHHRHRPAYASVKLPRVTPRTTTPVLYQSSPPKHFPTFEDLKPQEPALRYPRSLQAQRPAGPLVRQRMAPVRMRAGNYR